MAASNEAAGPAPTPHPSTQQIPVAQQQPEALALAASAHASLKCADCHDDFDATKAHPAKPVDCVSCHDDTAAKHPFHPHLGATPIPPGADTSCAGCHGTHAIVAADSPGFAFTPGRQTEACGRCHTDARDHFLASAHARASVSSPDTPVCLTCHRTAVVPPAPGRPDLATKRAQVALCESCHVSKPSVAGQTLRGSHFVASFEKSVHGAALSRGKAEAANCVDCHGAHDADSASGPGARVGKAHAAETCGGCHPAVAADYGQSVHASALRRGGMDSPTCPDCHGEHDIRGRADPSSPVYAGNVARQVCATCHASLPLARKYGLESSVFQTFSDSYHGLAAREGALAVANCASCHGAHAIKASSDPTSSINRRNLAATCGRCHPGANARFTFGSVHVSPETPAGMDGSSPVLHLVAGIYVLLIVVVVGGMFVHNVLDFLKKLRRKIAVQKGALVEKPLPHRLHLRMSGHERLQHAGLALSFTVLVVTGFMLHYPDAWWVQGLRHLSASVFTLRGLVHRIAGAVLIATGLWHTAYVAFSPRGRILIRDLLPRWNDLTDPWKVAKYNLGLAPDKPRFGRFCYIEKAEYWAVIWGSIVMGLTGAVLWFDNVSMGLLTKLGFDVSRTIHFYEAVLATLAIGVWHLYFVIFNPDVYPMNLSWLTGHMSEAEMDEEHPLELERENQMRTPPALPPIPSDPPSAGEDKKSP